MKVVIVLISYTFVVNISCFHLPPGITTCSKSDPDFDECLRKSVEDGVYRLSTGDKHLGVVPYEPLYVAMISVDENPGATVRVAQKFLNIKIHGLSLTKVKKFKVDFDSCYIYAETLSPLVRTEAEYELKGQLLIFPVNAKGNSNVTTTNLSIEHNITCQRYMKRGKEYIHLNSYKITAKPEGITYNFDNLFEGNRRLSEQIHKTINERALAIFEEVRGVTEESYSLIFKEIGNKIFNRIPFSEIFKD
ncbi:hypothetical protein RN001_010469 [Aquatica leii]|uniref:Protein takeout-like n=1 Tax=Aquatica leii TaxID=1421715 RepID=A0AAN7SNB5_9COLE|nr:hypothetical protein RN001_010469 [Aquatica leii]